MADALEIVDANEFVGNIAFGSKPSSDNEIFGLGSTSIGSLDVPAAFVSVELGFDDNTIERRMTFDVQDFVAVIEICSEVFVSRIVGWPGPVLVCLWDGQLIFWDLVSCH